MKLNFVRLLAFPAFFLFFVRLFDRLALDIPMCTEPQHSATFSFFIPWLESCVSASNGGCDTTTFESMGYLQSLFVSSAISSDNSMLIQSALIDRRPQFFHLCVTMKRKPRCCTSIHFLRHVCVSTQRRFAYIWFSFTLLISNVDAYYNGIVKCKRFALNENGKRKIFSLTTMNVLLNLPMHRLSVWSTDPFCGQSMQCTEFHNRNVFHSLC